MDANEIVNQLAYKYIEFINSNKVAPNKLQCSQELVNDILQNIDGYFAPLHSSFRINIETYEVFYAGCDIQVIDSFSGSEFVFLYELKMK